MTRAEVYETLNQVFQEVFDDDGIQVNDDTTAADIDGWDSLTHINLIDAVEDEFDVRFDMNDVVGMKNVGEMVDIILREE